MTMQDNPFAAPGSGSPDADASDADATSDDQESPSTVAELGENLKSMAKDQIQNQADSAKAYAVRRIRRVGAALRWAGEGLKEEDELIAGYAERASERISRMADYVDSSTAEKVMEDAGRIARERPAVFFGGAFLLGLAAGRFLKSSQADDSEEPAEVTEGPSHQKGGSNQNRPSKNRGRTGARDRQMSRQNGRSGGASRANAR